MAKRYTSLADYFRRGPETQEQLAERIGISQPTISLAMNHGKGSYKTLKKISEATGVPLESFDPKAAA
jgi:transcriptional regulator with XRE-family HTH domain